MHTKGLPYVEILMRHLPNPIKGIYPGNFFSNACKFTIYSGLLLANFSPFDFFL